MVSTSRHSSTQTCPHFDTNEHYIYDGLQAYCRSTTRSVIYSSYVYWLPDRLFFLYIFGFAFSYTLEHSSITQPDQCLHDLQILVPGLWSHGTYSSFLIAKTLGKLRWHILFIILFYHDDSSKHLNRAPINIKKKHYLL